MRRFFVYGLTIALLAACSAQEKDFQTPQQEDVIYYASFEQPAEEGTRVYANEDLLLRWTADDRVSIFGKNTYNQQYKFLGETGENSGGFSKVDGAEYVTGNPISHTVSVYPYQASTKITESEVLTVTLPGEQSYARNTFGLGANTMVSVSEENVLQYKNVGGYLMLKLYGEGVSVSSLTLKGNNGEKLAGKASVTISPDGVPSVVMGSDATTEITLTCAEPVLLGTTEEESTLFWLVIPPVTFDKGFTITVRENGGFFRTETAKTLTIARNKLSKMSPIEVPVPEPRQLDSLALVAIFNATGGAENWHPDRVWDLSKPIDQWYGVKINMKGRVTQLNLNNGTINAQWTLPAAVGDLTEMTEFRIIGNNLTGTIPEDIYNLTKLVSFSLTNNTPTWVLSSKIAGMTDLQDLYINQNPNLTGTLPKELGQLKKLVNINFSQTSISGFVPSELSGCASLKNLMGFNTQISGIPDNFDQWPSLKTIMLNGNPGLTGSLPASVGNCTNNLSSVLLYECNFTGNMPESWANLPSTCAQLRIQGNKLKGVVPYAIQAHTNFSKWNADKFILPQQDGYGLTLDTPVPEAVELGLSVKWASFNLGATVPEEYGDYYAWGETEPMDDYSWATYKWCNGDYNKLTKYCSNSEYGYNGFTDTKTVLEMEDDAAQVNLRGKWRVPTDAEWTELRENCTWTWTTQNGATGYKVTSRKTGYTDKSIFLPAAGSRYNTYLFDVSSYGFYWSSSLDTDTPYVAWGMYFGSSFVYKYSNIRFYGQSVRPVSGDIVLVPVLSISLDKTEQELAIGETTELVATISPENATNKRVFWSSSNESVAIVSSEGIVTGLSAGSAVITVTTDDGGKTASCTVTVTNTAIPEAVDLGLSVKWSPFNLGASKPEEYGDYYAWGETQPKSDYSWSTYKWCNGAYDKLTKYCYTYHPYYWWNPDTIPDGKSVLDVEDDAASVNWGGRWRMPTHEEVRELYENCTWSFVVEDGVRGYRVSSNVPGHRDQSIFLPGTFSVGEYFYWSSSLETNEYSHGGYELSYSAYGLSLHEDIGINYHFTSSRCTAALVRPVLGDPPARPVTGIVLSGSLFVVDRGTNIRISATVYPENADNKEFSWVSDNESVVRVDSNGLVTGVNNGEAHVTALTSDQGKVATCTVVVKTPSTAPEMVDLGLSVKWATHNIGASSPEEYGDYFAWGEISTKTNYSLGTYKWMDSSNYLTKYNNDKSHGVLDYKKTLDLEDDVAHLYLGGPWRMPTKAECQELINKCDWKSTTRNGVVGYIVTSKVLGYTNRSIFLPAGGTYNGTTLDDSGRDCHYWTSSLNVADSFSANNMGGGYMADSGYIGEWSSRERGLLIRPVYED